VRWQKNNEISKRWKLTSPPLAFAKNQNMGDKIEKGNWQNEWMGDMTMGKCQDWHKNSYIVEMNYKHFQGRHGRLQLGNVYTCHGLHSTLLVLLLLLLCS
jgi:hypothetical protein